jgi:serine/threonine-protein kinase
MQQDQSALVGREIGPYRILSLLGSGGMGEVYLAEDCSLKRQVAIKILPEDFSRDPERVARFGREAQLLASLNHPCIGAIYGLEEKDTTRFLVLELVEGETLREKLEKGALPVEEALDIALQVAEGLEAAHEKGIIHRDLKPANVKITPEGKVKILDFGLAKVLRKEIVSGDVTQSLTGMTEPGVILGTAAYMSPEQARGKPVDKRADIWAFGCLLFEALSGHKPFAGRNITDILAAIVHETPNWGVLPPETPSTIQTLLRRCLEKDALLRLRDIGDARIVLYETVTGTAEKAPDFQTAGPWSFRKTLLAAVGGILLITVASVIAWTLKPTTELPFRKFDLAVENLEPSFAISPDGKKIAYVAEGGLWLRELDQLEPRKLSDTQSPSALGLGPNVSPALFWSPDSSWIGYVSAGKLWKAPVHGGGSTALTAGSWQVFENASWAPSGRIIFAASTQSKTGLLEMSAQGGEPRILLDIDRQGGDLDFHDPHVLPDGRGVLFIVHRAQHGNDTLALHTGKERRTLLQLAGQSLGFPVYSPTGHVLYQQGIANPTIWAVPFSLSTLEVAGEPFLVAPEAARPSLSQDGILVYLHGSDMPLWQLVWVDRQGVMSRPVIEIRGGRARPQLSPDGRRVAISIETSNWLGDIWLLDLGREVLTRLTFDGRSWYPRWTPDGKQQDRIVSTQTPGPQTGDFSPSLKSALRRIGTSTSSLWTVLANLGLLLVAGLVKKERGSRQTGGGLHMCPTNPARMKCTCGPFLLPAVCGRSLAAVAGNRSGRRMVASSSIARMTT